MPTFTCDWFSANPPVWKSRLAKYGWETRDEWKGLEIGSWEGRSALWIADTWATGKNSTLECIDTWEGSVEHSADSVVGLYDRFINNAKEHIDNGKIIPRRGRSADVLFALGAQIKSGEKPAYDFIYIDGSHVTPDVLTDAVLSFQLLKPGGVMIFDDYLWGQPQNLKRTDTPKMAIDAFIWCMEGHWELLWHEYQVALRKL